jgi:hypothetical protein
MTSLNVDLVRRVVGHPVRVTCTQRSHQPSHTRRVKQWERLYGSREIALYCGHVWVTRAWLCNGTTLTETDFVSGDPSVVQEEEMARAREGFDVGAGIFYFNTTTHSQMTTQGTWVARETAHRRVQQPRNAVLPDRFSPGPQACILATNGCGSSIRSTPCPSNDRVCSCTPIEITTFEELRSCRFIQVVLVAHTFSHGIQQ